MCERTRWLYVPVEGAELFTVVCLPEEGQSFPVLLIRTPYVDDMETMNEEEICQRLRQMHADWLENG